jgi:predicted RNA-binding protein with PIN domain
MARTVERWRRGRPQSSTQDLRRAVRLRLAGCVDDHPGGQSGKTIIVDGNNVIGSVADGWWRDRPAAVLRLLRRLACYRQHTGYTVILVLDVPQRDLPAGSHDGVEVFYPRRRGRDAADERILELLDERDLGDVEVVSSDRALAAGARDRRAGVVGAGAFLARLERSRC